MNHFPTVESSPTNSLLIIASPFWLRYLAVPYRLHGRDLNGWDCFGAVRYILNNHAGVRLPLWDMVSAAEILRQSARPEWVRQSKAKVFDVVCMDEPTMDGRRPLHVGIMVDEMHMLHSEKQIGTVCVPTTHATVRHRIRTLYRHRQLI